MAAPGLRSSPVFDTRVRFLRRLALVVVLVFLGLLALSQFTGLSRLAASVLASSALVAAVVGFAARQTIANLVAGVMLAVSQPLRIGDWVEFDDEYGEVEDVRLNYTVLRTGRDQRILIPNEKLAAGVLRNDSLVSPDIATEVTLLLARDADAQRAVEALEAETQRPVRVTGVEADGIRIAVHGPSVPPAERAGAEAELRLRCLRRLRADGLQGG